MILVQNLNLFCSLFLARICLEISFWGVVLDKKKALVSY